MKAKVWKERVLDSDFVVIAVADRSSMPSFSIGKRESESDECIV